MRLWSQLLRRLGGRIAWTQEAEVAVSQDCATALQPGDRARLCLKKKKSSLFPDIPVVHIAKYPVSELLRLYRKCCPMTLPIWSHGLLFDLQREEREGYLEVTRKTCKQKGRGLGFKRSVVCICVGDTDFSYQCLRVGVSWLVLSKEEVGPLS